LQRCKTLLKDEFRNAMGASAYIRTAQLLAQTRLGHPDDELENTVGHQERFLEGAPDTMFTAFCTAAIRERQVYQGRFLEVLGAMEALEPRLCAKGLKFFGSSHGIWMEAKLRAAVGASRHGALSRRQRQRAIKDAQGLARRGIWSFSAVGLWALAHLLYDDGNRVAARRQLEEALKDPRERCGDHARWMVLKSAAEMGLSSPGRAAEAARIEAERGYVMPQGW
jgi:hypothetical protein